MRAACNMCKRETVNQVNICELSASLLDCLKKAQQGHPFTVGSNGQVLADICAPETLQKQARDILKQVAKTAVADDVI